jgi:hypothetical protein
MYTHWRSIAQYYYCIRKTRLVKVFFFSISFSIYTMLYCEVFFYNIIPFSSKYEVTLCIIKICNIMYSKTSFSLNFLAQFMWHTWKKMSCIGNFFFISSLSLFDDFHDGPCCYFTFFLWLGHLVSSSSSFNASFYDEVKETTWSALIFSPHIICYFISYVRNVIVVEGQYFTRIVLFHFFLLISAF